MRPSPALEGRHVRLEPLTVDHVEGLLAAATGDRATFGYTQVPWDRPSMEAYVAHALAKAVEGDQVPFATWSHALGRVVGTTRFYELAPWDWTALFPGSDTYPSDGVPPRASIGHTWLDPVVHRTPVNTEAKVLMLDHAFTAWGVLAVRIQTDARNARSRAAIERLGCSLDGVLRVDRPATDGTVRDSAIYSMRAEEWPAHRMRLVAALGR
jgi:RimJ/RimL family protein N-acetyltransferase